MEAIELKNIITKIEKVIDGLNSRMEGTEEIFSEVENLIIEITQSGQEKMNSGLIFYCILNIVGIMLPWVLLNLPF